MQREKEKNKRRPAVETSSGESRRKYNKNRGKNYVVMGSLNGKKMRNKSYSKGGF